MSYTLNSVDYIVAELARMCDDLRSDIGCDSLLDVNISAAAVISDVLSAVGLPVQVQRLVLGDDLNVLEGHLPGEPVVSCNVGARCDHPAAGAVLTANGWRLACDRHLLHAEAGGFEVRRAAPSTPFSSLSNDEQLHFRELEIEKRSAD